MVLFSIFTSLSFLILSLIFTISLRNTIKGKKYTSHSTLKTMGVTTIVMDCFSVAFHIFATCIANSVLNAFGGADKDQAIARITLFSIAIFVLLLPQKIFCYYYSIKAIHSRKVIATDNSSSLQEQEFMHFTSVCCPKCDTTLINNASFCHNCGRKTNSGDNS